MVIIHTHTQNLTQPRARKRTQKLIHNIRDNNIHKLNIAENNHAYANKHTRESNEFNVIAT